MTVGIGENADVVTITSDNIDINTTLIILNAVQPPFVHYQFIIRFKCTSDGTHPAEMAPFRLMHMPPLFKCSSFLYDLVAPLWNLTTSFLFYT